MRERKGERGLLLLLLGGSLLNAAMRWRKLKEQQRQHQVLSPFS